MVRADAGEIAVEGGESDIDFATNQLAQVAVNAASGFPGDTIWRMTDASGNLYYRQQNVVNNTYGYMAGIAIPEGLAR